MDAGSDDDWIRRSPDGSSHGDIHCDFGASSDSGVCEMTRQPGLQIGSKMFWFNIQTAKTGAQYLAIVSDVKGKKEKMTLFPSQIPSFMHMIRESYTELVRNMELEEAIAEEVVIAPKINIEAVPDDLLRACPECGLDGTDAQKPDVSMRNGGALVTVMCIDGCGYKWPEGDQNWGRMELARKIWDTSWLIEVFKRHG